MQTDLDQNGGETGTIPAPAHKLSIKQLMFCDLVVEGHSYGSAYRIAYKRAKMDIEDAREAGYRVSLGRGVKERIQWLRSKSTAKSLLSLNDRLHILAQIAQDPKARPTEKVRAIEVYSKISGDQAPERHEVSGPGGVPLLPSNPIERVPVAARIEAIRAARKRIPQ